jgi:hypothetical protein
VYIAEEAAVFVVDWELFFFKFESPDEQGFEQRE